MRRRYQRSIVYKVTRSDQCLTPWLYCSLRPHFFIVSLDLWDLRVQLFGNDELFSILSAQHVADCFLMGNELSSQQMDESFTEASGISERTSHNIPGDSIIVSIGE